MILLGPTPYYRLTPAVYWWLIAAGETITDESQARIYVETMHEVGRFVELAYGRAAIEGAKTPRPTLPAIEHGPE